MCVLHEREREREREREKVRERDWEGGWEKESKEKDIFLEMLILLRPVHILVLKTRHHHTASEPLSMQIILNLIRYHGQPNCYIKLFVRVWLQTVSFQYMYMCMHVHTCGVMMREKFTHQHVTMVGWLIIQDLSHDCGVASIMPCTIILHNSLLS